MSRRLDFDREPYTVVTAMGEQAARAFVGPRFFKLLLLGQAIGPRYRFGARSYACFATREDWEAYRTRARVAYGPLRRGASRADLMAAMATLGFHGVDLARASEAVLWRMVWFRVRIARLSYENAPGVLRC